MSQYTVRVADIEDLSEAQIKRLFDTLEEWGADVYIKDRKDLWTVEVNAFTPEDIRLYAYTEWPDPGEMGTLLQKMGIGIGLPEGIWQKIAPQMTYHGRGRTRFGTYRHRVQSKPSSPKALFQDIVGVSVGLMDEDRENWKEFLSWAEDNMGAKEWSPRR